MSLRLCLVLLAVLLATRPGLAQVPRGGGGGATSPLTVEELDANPLVSAVTTIKVSNGTLTNNGGGTVTILTGGTNTPAGSSGDLQTNSGSGSFSAYGGVTCTNSVLTSLDSAAQGGCNQVTFSAISSGAYSTDTTLAGDSSVKLPTEHAVKTYVDAVAFTGLTWKNAVRVATTVAGTLASSFENGDTVDGVTLATNDRILIKNQVDQTANGVYTVAASGAPTRVTDIDASAEFNGATVLVTSGTTNISSVWTQTTVSPTVGVSNIVWVAINAGTAYLAGDGLSLTGNTFAVDTTVVRTTRTLTVAGTSNEITSSAGAQDLSANRTWTLSLPTNLDLSTKVLQGASPLVFEGATADAFETTLAITDPTADRTITLPNESGVVCTTGSVCSGYGASTLHYVTTQAESGLSAEANLGALTTGLLLNTVSAGVATLSKFAGSACGAGLYANAVSASGVLTCDLPAGGGGGGGTIGGSGTAGTIPLFFSSVTLTDSGLTDNGSVLTVNRGYRGKVAAKSADYTLTTADYQIDCTAGSGGITLTLPSASGLTGQHYVIYKVDTDVGACTVAPNGSNLLNGVNGAVTSLTTAYAGLAITQVSSTAWTVVSLGPLAIGDTISASTDASVLTVGTGGVLGQVTPGTDGKVFTMVSGVPAWAAAAGGVAIGDTVTSGTAGSVLWLDTAGVLAQDNAHLFYDPTVKQVLVGTNNPTPGSLDTSTFPDLGLSRVLVAAQSGDTPYASLSVVGASRTTALNLIGMGGTLASPAATPADTQLNLNFFATDATYGNIVAIVSAVSRGDQSVSGAGELGFYTSNATFTVYERSRITSAGTTGVDATACTSNGSTHCLAGQVEAQESLTAGSMASVLSGYTASSVSYSLSTLTGGATTVTLGDDQASAQITIPFNFVFFGDIHTHVYIASNGYVEFDSGSSAASAETLPDDSVPGIIAAYWTDLDPSGGGTIKYQTLGTTPNRIFVVQFDSIPRCCEVTADVSFQIKLFETSSNIEIHSSSADNHGDNPVTQGVQGFAQHSFSGAGIRAITPTGRNHANFTLTNEAVRFTPGDQTFAPGTGGLRAANVYAKSLLAIGTEYDPLELTDIGYDSTSTPSLILHGVLPQALIVSTGTQTGVLNFISRGGTTQQPTDTPNSHIIGAIGFANTVNGAPQAGVSVAGATDSTGYVYLTLGGHVLTSTATPTVAGTTANACGTSAPSIAGTDMAGRVTVGATAGTSCTVTFSHAFVTAPSCTVTNETTANLVRATSSTSTVILAGTMVAADKLAYVCLGY